MSTQTLTPPTATEPAACCGPSCCGGSAAATAAPTDAALKQAINTKYSQIAATVRASQTRVSCCGDGRSPDPVTVGLYNPAEQAELPASAVLASLGCGNPTALAELKAGEVVLDLGSGGGIDVLLSAKRVGPTGFAYGLDQSDEMLALARQNQAEAGVRNVVFLKGEIEHIPLPSESVDVVISNCVINLSLDKAQVLREAARVLKPGGRFAVADIVALRPLPTQFRAELEAWVGCLAGALEKDDYAAKLAAAGFTNVDFEITRRYNLDDLPASDAKLAQLRQTFTADELAHANDTLVSAFVRATK